jgi:hypothetical protein
MNSLKRLGNLSLFVLIAFGAWAQTTTPAATLMPVPRIQFFDASGRPLAGGLVFTYAAGTSTPLATFTDSSGTIQNTNPVILDSGGFASIWIGPQAYKVAVQDSNGAQQWVVDNVSDTGQLLYQLAVLLNPAGGSLQTITGPLAATYFQGTSPHTTSPGVRVSILDPITTLDTSGHPPNISVTDPALSGQVYTIPDPGTATANFVLSPNSTGNVLDCTQTGITCKRSAYVYFDGGSCNNATPLLGWDTFGSNSPSPMCVTGTNVQKGVLALPSAATRIQSASCTGAAAGTCVVTIPAATTAGDLLEVECAVDGGKTITGATDGTNAYTLAVAKTNGNTDLEIWYFNGNSTSVAAASSLTVTLSAAANSACRFHEYSGILTASALDKTANNSGTGTAVTSGTTTGTAQAVELVLAAVASPSNPSVAAQAGFVQHTVVSQSTNVTVDSEGLIQQAIAAQSGAFTLGSSQAWAAAVATFKVNVGAASVGQRSFSLPAYFDATRPVNGAIKWQAPQLPTGAVTVKLGGAISCTPDGNTDDPVFNTAVTPTSTVNASSASVLTTTPLTALTSTGCAASGMLHYQIERLRYDLADTYEGWVFVDGASLQFGITQ